MQLDPVNENCLPALVTLQEFKKKCLLALVTLQELPGCTYLNWKGENILA